MMLAALAAAASLSACTPVPGAERLWESPATRYVMVGETHGTNEAPSLFGDLVCAAAKKRRVVVALEHWSDQQGAMNAFLASDGSPAARTKFLASPMWNAHLTDGRTSEAMLALFQRLREFKQAGAIRSVVAFDDYDLSVPFSNADEGANRGMAKALQRTAAANPDALVLGYAGSLHMSHHAVGNTGIPSAAGRLPRAEAVSVFIDGGGSAWNCANNECAPHQLLPLNDVCKAAARGVVPYPKEGLPPGFDAVACVGKPFTASPPAVPLTRR